MRSSCQIISAAWPALLGVCKNQQEVLQDNVFGQGTMPYCWMYSRFKSRRTQLVIAFAVTWSSQDHDAQLHPEAA